MKRETLTPAEQDSAQKPTTKMEILMLVAIGLGFFIFCGALGKFMYLVLDKWPQEARQRRNEFQKVQQETSQTTEDTTQQKLQDKYYPTYEQARERLYELAQYGVHAPFKDYLVPSMVRYYVLHAMNREDIAFGTGGMTMDEIDKLTTKAEVKIAGQKLAYLKANGGVKRPSDLELLQDVCEQVYLYKHRSLIEGTPTDEELKQLLPPGVTYVRWCHWPGAKQN